MADEKDLKPTSLSQDTGLSQATGASSVTGDVPSDAPQQTTEKPSTTDSLQPSTGLPKARFIMRGKFKAPAPVPQTQHLDEKDLLDKNATEPQSLLDQIAAPDRAKLEREKKKAKPAAKERNHPFLNYLKSLSMADVKRKINAFKEKVRLFLEKYAKVFRVLSVVWGIGMFCLYIAGITFFALFSIIFFEFEPLLKRHLRDMGFKDLTFKMETHSLSEVVLTDIKDGSGMFTVGKLQFQYNISDLLDGVISVATVNDLVIRLEEDENGAIPLENLFRTFVKLDGLEKTSPFKIKDMQIQDSKLLLGMEEVKTTVPFYGTGNIKDQKKFTFPVTIQNQYLTANNARLETEMIGNETTWKLSFEKGQLPLFPNQETDAVLTWQTRLGRIQSVSLLASMVDSSSGKTSAANISRIKKELSLSAIPTQKDETFNVDFSLKLSGGDFPKPIDITMGIKNASLMKNLKGFTTSSPVELNIANFKSHLFDAEVLHAKMDGLFECSETGCFYIIKKNSDLSLENPTVKIDESKWIVPLLRLILLPNDNAALSWDGKRVQYNFTTRHFSFDSHKQSASASRTQAAIRSTERASFNIKKAAFSGFYEKNEKEQNTQTNIGLDLESFQNNSASMKNAIFNGKKTNDLWEVRLKTDEFQLKKNDLFKPPFALDLDMSEDSYFTAKIQTLNKQLDVSAQGYYNPYSGEIYASLKSNTPVVFSKDSLQPIQISSLFGEEITEEANKTSLITPKQKYKGITDVSGKIRFKGEIHYKNNRSIDAPLHVLFDDVSFKYGNMEVKHFNSIMTLSHLIPFGTNGVQKATAQYVLAVLPFTGVSTSFLFDASRKQFNLLSLDAELAGYPLRVDPSWFTYDLPTYTFIMKGKMAALDKWFDQTTFKNDLKLKGEGTIDLSIKEEDGKLSLKSFEMSIPTSGSVAYTKDIEIDSLKVLADTPFKKASLRLNQLPDDTSDVVIMVEYKNLRQGRKRANIRLNISDVLNDFFLPTKPVEILPENFSKLKAAF